MREMKIWVVGVHHQAAGTRQPAPGSHHQAAGTRQPAPGSRHQAATTRQPPPGSRPPGSRHHEPDDLKQEHTHCYQSSRPKLTTGPLMCRRTGQASAPPRRSGTTSEAMGIWTRHLLNLAFFKARTNVRGGSQDRAVENGGGGGGVVCRTVWLSALK